MVTSFIVHSDLNTSANLLDHSHAHGHHPRLNNQCREAIMMINYLEKINFIVQMFNFPVCPTYQSTDSIEIKVKVFLAQVNWAKEVVSTYRNHCKQQNMELAVSSTTYRWITYGDKDMLSPGEKFLFKGYINHPATLAWAGHLNALKYYCNVHRDVSIKRGYHVTIPEYPVQEPIQFPWWVTNDIMHTSYRNNLLWKEIVRNEPPWYTVNEYFTSVAEHPIYGCGNLWLAKLDYDTLLLIANNQVDQLKFWQICDPPNYSNPKSKVQIVEEKGKPGKHGWCLYQIYTNQNIHQYFRNASRKSMLNMESLDQSIRSCLTPKIKININ